MCAFRFVGSNTLSGSENYIFGSPAYEAFNIVHSIGNETISFSNRTEDASVSLFELPADKQYLVFKAKTEDDGSVALGIKTGVLFAIMAFYSTL